MPADTVADLVNRAAAGDANAWTSLVDEFAGLVWAITRAHRLNRDDAADVTQDTFARLVEHLAALQQPERVGAWLATTARRECLAVLRQRARVVPLGDAMPDVPADDPTHASVVVAAERAACVRVAFARLRPSDQSLLRLLMREPALSYEEISASLGMPIGSIGPTRARALARLRGELEKLGVTDEDLSA
jgi:RNA polymerase sigma factor (sigma-70 family)